MEGLKGYDEASDIRDDLEPKEIRTIQQHLRTFGIFYAAPLDLDYAMLQKFQAAYKHPQHGHGRGGSQAGLVEQRGTP
ncbi:hypothetical protein [Streptomyces sp. DT203]|uniref:hypothetical protein n=1 Tax=Streptomyces sp. DT203 TaxID=3393424 RepID=UPI003CE9057B